MKRVIKKTCKAGGDAVMISMFWVGAVLIGASMAMNYKLHKEKREDLCSTRVTL